LDFAFGNLQRFAPQGFAGFGGGVGFARRQRLGTGAFRRAACLFGLVVGGGDVGRSLGAFQGNVQARARFLQLGAAAVAQGGRQFAAAFMAGLVGIPVRQ